MRELKTEELEQVSGGTGVCVPTDANNIAGVTNPGGLGKDLINIYEGLVMATSHVIERVATAFKN